MKSLPKRFSRSSTPSLILASKKALDASLDAFRRAEELPEDDEAGNAESSQAMTLPLRILPSYLLHVIDSEEGSEACESHANDGANDDAGDCTAAETVRLVCRLVCRLVIFFDFAVDPVGRHRGGLREVGGVAAAEAFDLSAGSVDLVDESGFEALEKLRGRTIVRSVLERCCDAVCDSRGVVGFRIQPSFFSVCL
eukprot:scaffold2265_cov198-Pinguiococcus_pyrenoidosus.AAC.3